MITDPCPTTVMSTTPIGPFTYLVYQPSLVINIPLFTESVGFCGPFTYTLTTNPDTTVFAFDPLTPLIRAYTEDFTKIGGPLTLIVTGTLFNGL